MRTIHMNWWSCRIGKRALRNKWVYKLKLGDTGKPPRYKARIVVKGFQQKKGVDFDEIFAPIVKMNDLHPNGAEYSSQHEPRGRAFGREDGIPSR